MRILATCVWLSCLALAGGGPTVAAAEEPSAAIGFAGAGWIWYSREPMPASIDFPAGRAWFRGTFELPNDAKVIAAELAITCDNLWVVHLNGKPAGGGEMQPDAWSRPRRIQVSSLLQGGRNTVAVAAVNTAPGPAGLLVTLRATLADGKQIAFTSNESWRCSDRDQAGWEQAGFDDSAWQAAHWVGAFGMAPWGAVAWPAAAVDSGPVGNAPMRRFRQLANAALRSGRGGLPVPLLREPQPAERWPEALAFIGGDCSLYRPPAHSGSSRDSLSVTIFNPNHGRAYPEHDLPAPVKVGRQLLVLRPARPGVDPQVLWDAGRGALGSPAVSYDGRWIYFSMAAEGDAFFHLYRLPATGGTAERLTDGPFHDIDPCELPDGRLVFSSTRIGTFEEYHNPPSRALFVRESDGRIRPLTRTFQFDNEAKMLADGRLLMLRTDNFFDRGKVETMLHAIFPDGRHGLTEFGLDMGPEYGNRLRAFNAGSAAPMPDGRVAWVDGAGVLVARPGEPAEQWRRLAVPAADVSALADGRLVCTVAAGGPGGKAGEWPFRALGLLDPDASEPEILLLHQSAAGPIHSPVAVGPRQPPPRLAAHDPASDAPGQTGVFFCQNIGTTQHHTAGWRHVRAVRVLAGYGLTLRSSHSYLVHAGSEVVELGTVPIAPDGSFAIEVPADTAIALQAVDAEGRSEINQMSWMFVRPGETRSCIGCHQPRHHAPPATGGFPQALSAPPLKLTEYGHAPRFRGNNAAVTGLMELQFDRFRETAGLNNHGRADGNAPTPTDDLAALLADLQSRDPARRQSAAQRAAILRTPQLAAALADCLKSEARELRVAAALALAACGNTASLAPLAAALGDADPLVAQAAAIAVENLRGEALPGFNAFAPHDERRAVGAGLAALTPTVGPDWLARRTTELSGSDRDQARRAAVALAHCAGTPAAASLTETFLAWRTNNPYPAWRADHSHRGDGARFNSLAAVNPRALQEVTRALGATGGDEVVPLLAATIAAHLDPETGNLFLAEAAVEGLARVGSPTAEKALLELLGRLPPYFTHSRWYGDHDALIACHAAPVHARLVAALDRMGSTGAGPMASVLVRMVPTDPDRALMPASDDFENLIGRVIRRSGRGGALVETCLHALGDPSATAPDGELLTALGDVHAAWAGRPCREIRAAQILSLAARDPASAPRVLDAFRRFRERPNPIPRVYDKGIPVVNELPPRHWVCFYLARTLGQLGAKESVATLAESLRDELAEASGGRPDPLGPGVLFLHNDLTPCWRAGAAWALGRLGDPAAIPALRAVLANLDNAPDTRHAAAVALGRLTPPHHRAALAALAATVPEVSIRQALLEAADGTVAQ